MLQRTRILRNKERINISNNKIDIKKMALLPLAVLAIGGVVFLGANSVSARSPTDTLTEKIATRFNLDEGEVEKFFDELKEEKQADREVKMSEYLQKKVDEGVISEEQKTQLEEKRAEVFEAIIDIKEQGLPKEETMQKIKEIHKDFKSWADQNDIPIDDLKPEHFEGKRKIHHGGHRKF